MARWTDGYVTEIPYTYGYYTETNPVRIQLALLNAGVHVPEVRNACELAFGQGISANLHAAGSSAQWWGNDFNPEQACYAQEMARASGSGASFTDESFEEFCSRTDLPDFDFIALHGIYSWVTHDNQQRIEDFLRRKLRMGGVLYISYNTYPGWAPMMGIRHLMAQHAKTMSAESDGVIKQMTQSLDFVSSMMKTQPRTLSVAPTLAEQVEKLKSSNPHYLTHEYFNENWQPMFFEDMARRMEACKLTYACSASLSSAVDAIQLTVEQQKFLAAIPHSIFRESARDHIVNQAFRRDVWIKGARRLTAPEQLQKIRDLRVTLIVPREDVQLTIATALGNATLDERIYGSILELLERKDVLTVGQIEAGVTPKGFNFAQIWQAILVLLGKNDLMPVQDAVVAEKARARVQNLNRWILERARYADELQYMASPLTGGGVAVSHIHQLFLLASQSGCKTADQYAAWVWNIFAARGQKVIAEGKPLDSAEESVKQLSVLAADFLAKRVQILRKLQVA